MKKLLSILLAGAMVFGLASAAMADPLTGNADAPSSQNVDISVEIGESFEWSVPAEIKMTDTGTAMKSDDYTIEISKAVLAPNNTVVLTFTPSPSDCLVNPELGMAMCGEALMRCGDASLFYHISLDGVTYNVRSDFRNSNSGRGMKRNYEPAGWTGQYLLTLSEGAASVVVNAAVVDKEYYTRSLKSTTSTYGDGYQYMCYDTNHVAGDYSTTITFEAKVTKQLSK